MSSSKVAKCDHDHDPEFETFKQNFRKWVEQNPQSLKDTSPEIELQEFLKQLDRLSDRTGETSEQRSHCFDRWIQFIIKETDYHHAVTATASATIATTPSITCNCNCEIPRRLSLPYQELDSHVDKDEVRSRDDNHGAFHCSYPSECLKLGSGELTMDFCSMGMFIIDEINFASGEPSLHDVIGGAGTWAALGARLVKPDCPHLVSFIVHRGYDFPKEIHETLESWCTGMHCIDTPERETTRGWNMYIETGKREFQYTNSKVRVDETSLTEHQLLSKSFHLICSPARCIALVKGILQRRQEIIDKGKRIKDTVDGLLRPLDHPIFVWEPVPDSCKRSQLNSILKAMRYVDVISPNHLELASMFEEREDDDIFLACELEIMEKQCNELLKTGFGDKPSAVIIRLGERGCYVASQSRHMWLPSYFRPVKVKGDKKKRVATKENEKTVKTEMHVVTTPGQHVKATEKVTEKGAKKHTRVVQWHVKALRERKRVLTKNVKSNPRVVDPTGGGNTFLGALCIGLLQSDTEWHKYNNFEHGAIYGAVAASFAIQQVGMPTLSEGPMNKDGFTPELWNGETFASRLQTYLKRLKPGKVSTMDVAVVKRSQLYVKVAYKNPFTGAKTHRVVRRPAGLDQKMGKGAKKENGMPKSISDQKS